MVCRNMGTSTSRVTTFCPGALIPTTVLAFQPEVSFRKAATSRPLSAATAPRSTVSTLTSMPPFGRCAWRALTPAHRVRVSVSVEAAQTDSAYSAPGMLAADEYE